MQSLVHRHRHTVGGLLFLSPFLAVYITFLVFPFLKGVWISLHEWDLLAVVFDPGAKRLVGLENYLDTFWGSAIRWNALSLWPLKLLAILGLAVAWIETSKGRMKRQQFAWLALGALAVIVLLGLQPGAEGRWFDRRFWPTVGNTLLFVLLTVPLITAISLALALALNHQTKVMATFRTLFFLSQVLSVTVVTLIWQMMYSPRQGLLANMMGLVGLEPFSWITHESGAMAAIVIATVWWSIGFPMVIYLAGLQQIPKERYEAARLDGAGAWAMLRYIILPGLRRTTTFVIVLQIVLHFQVFGQSHLITQGGPNDNTQVLVRYIYQTAFRDSDLGHASSIAMFLFLLMLGFSLLQLRVSREDEQ